MGPARHDQPEALDPPYLFADYRSTVLRSPGRALVVPPAGRSELTGPQFGPGDVRETDADLTVHGDGEAIGERIIVHGRVTDGLGRPVRSSLVEVWQANAAGRYIHQRDQHPAPLDPNFVGAGRCLTDEDGRYRFTTIKPGPYPWRNHGNAWRPAHIHFSLFGRAFTQRLVTQMYFPGDPLFYQDPIFNGVRDESARKRMIAGYDHETTVEEWATGYRFDIVLGGRDATAGAVMEFVYEVTDVPASAGPTPWQTVGPFFHYALPYDTGPQVVGAGRAGAFSLHGVAYDGEGTPLPDALLEVWQADESGDFAQQPGIFAAPADDGFRGFGRCATDGEGRFAFTTVKPAGVPTEDGTAQAPHLAVSVLARGMLRRAVTRVYFDDSPENATDPLLASLDPTRAATLVAVRDDEGYRFDVRLQGADETVFLDVSGH